ncbi:MAG: hypothetical protein PHU85_11840 [Phycisphaerae bacterium]|nr:hypothetical protein [Phycisphaerae bacterium]
MAGDPYRKPNPGDPLRIPAHLMAELIESLPWIRAQRDHTGRGRRARPRPYGVYLVQNDSGADREFGHILGVANTQPTPTDNLSAFKEDFGFKGVAPQFPAHDGKFCVLLEAVPSGKIGWGRFVGLAAVQVEITSGLAWYDYADVTHDDATKLTLLPSGAAQVLWKEEGTGKKWALVRLGNPHGNVTLQMKLDAALTAKSSAAASIWDGDPLADTGNNCTLHAGEDNGSLMSSGSSFPSGKYVWGTWFPRSRKWQLSNAGC